MTEGTYAECERSEVLALRRQLELLARERVQDRRQLEEKNRLLAAYQEIGRTILSSLDSDEILDALAEQVVRAGIFRSLTVGLVNWEEGVVELVRNFVCINPQGKVTPGESIRPSPNGADPSRVVESVPIIGRRIALEEPFDLMSLTVRRGSLLVVGYIGDVGGKRDVKMAYFIPIFDRGRVIAVLATGSHPDEQGLIVRRIENMAPLFDQVAVALEHSRLYRRLGEERERLTVTLRSIGDAVLTTDAQGHITLLNRVAEALTGWGQEEARGRELDEVFRCYREDTREAEPSPLNGVLRKGSGPRLSRRLLLLGRDGGEHLVRLSSAPIRDDAGQTVGAVLVARDVTRQQRMEEELYQARRIESLGLLASGIAHDFNNILASVQVNVSVLKMQLRGQDPLLHIVRDVEKSLGMARELTEQLMSFTRGAAPVRAVASLEDLVRDSAGFVLRGSNVHCEYEVGTGLWAVDIDSAQISQVVQNLIINADQAMPGGGTIRIDLQNVHIGEGDLLPLEEGRYVSCAIADEGTGIADEDIGRIFDPYFTTKPRGNGLGLTMSYSIVTGHGGWISATSRPGEGTTFTFWLPASLQEAVRAPSPEQVLAIGSGRVLLMDDDAQLREAAGRALGQLGYQVEHARSGEEALDLCQRRRGEGERFDAIIMDLTVPGGMGAREAAQRLRDIDPEVRLILSSGYSKSPLVAEYRRHGFQDVVVKPYGAEELARVLGRLLSPG